MIDSRGNLWIGSFWGGVSKYDGKRFTNFTKDGIIKGETAFNNGTIGNILKSLVEMTKMKPFITLGIIILVAVCINTFLSVIFSKITLFGFFVRGIIFFIAFLVVHANTRMRGFIKHSLFGIFMYN